MRPALLMTLALIFPAPLAAQESKPQEPEKPITERSPTMGDAVATPASDLNLKKDAIPPLLISAQERPYDLARLKRCSDIAAAVGELDAVLGPDIDLPQDAARRTSAGSVAQAAVGSFIPFRGLIREISGANESQRKLQAAVQAGIARRSFLKGVGGARGCRYPASPASAADIAALTAPAVEAKPAPARTGQAPATGKPAANARGVTYVSQPVVQPTRKRKK
jgi:hypothetical protein